MTLPSNFTSYSIILLRKDPSGGWRGLWRSHSVAGKTRVANFKLISVQAFFRRALHHMQGAEYAVPLLKTSHSCLLCHRFI